MSELNPNDVEGSPGKSAAQPYDTKGTTNNLTDGLLKIYQPDLQKVESQLTELTKKQKVLIEQLHNENLKLSWAQHSSEFAEMFTKIQVYRDKLVAIKKDMQVLHDRSTKLKKRAIRLQTFKEKQETTREEQRRKELELIGK